MNFPVFHKYFSINSIICLTTVLVLLHFFLILIFPIFPDLYYIFLILVFSYITYYFLASFFIILIPIEFLLRKFGHIVKYNVVNIPIKFQKYIYIFVTLIYTIITIVGIIIGQPMTEEELLYD